MRIRDTRRDYYDGVQRNQMFSADDVVYVRKPLIINEDVDKRFTLPTSINNLFSNVRDIMYSYDLYGDNRYCYSNLIRLSVVGFCNKIYPVILLETITNVVVNGVYTGESVTVWRCFLSVNQCMDSDYYQTLFRSLPKKVRHYISNDLKSVIDTCTRNMLIVENDKSLLTIFEKYNTPIFQFANDFGFSSEAEHYNRNQLLINPLLKDINFQSIVDPFTAFQELHRYMINQAQPDRPMVAISNSDKIVKAGYDLKTSFRKCKL